MTPEEKSLQELADMASANEPIPIHAKILHRAYKVLFYGTEKCNTCAMIRAYAYGAGTVIIAYLFGR